MDFLIYDSCDSSDDEKILWSDNDDYNMENDLENDLENDMPKNDFSEEEIDEDDIIINNDTKHHVSDNDQLELVDTKVIEQKINFKITKNKSIKIIIELNINNRNINISFPINRTFFLKLARKIK